MATPKKTKEVFEYLKWCASAMRTATYKEVADEVGLTAVGMAYPLGHIRDKVCRKRDLPWLNALAVNGTSWRPGDAFLPYSVKVPKDEEERLWRGMVLQVYAYDWTKIRF